MTLDAIKRSAYNIASSYDDSKRSKNSERNPFKDLNQDQRDLLIKVLGAKNTNALNPGDLKVLKQKLDLIEVKSLASERGGNVLKGLSRSIQNIFGRTRSEKVYDKVVKARTKGLGDFADTTPHPAYKGKKSKKKAKVHKMDDSSSQFTSNPMFKKKSGEGQTVFNSDKSEDKH